MKEDRPIKQATKKKPRNAGFIKVQNALDQIERDKNYAQETKMFLMQMMKNDAKMGDTDKGIELKSNPNKANAANGQIQPR